MGVPRIVFGPFPLVQNLWIERQMERLVGSGVETDYYSMIFPGLGPQIRKGHQRGFKTLHYPHLLSPASPSMRIEPHCHYTRAKKAESIVREAPLPPAPFTLSRWLQVDQLPSSQRSGHDPGPIAGGGGESGSFSAFKSRLTTGSSQLVDEASVPVSHTQANLSSFQRWWGRVDGLRPPWTECRAHHSPLGLITCQDT